MEGGGMEILELKPIIESMIFVSDEPITEGAILVALAGTGVEKATIREALAAIENEWNGDPSRGVGIAQVAGGYQFRTKASCADWLKRLNVPKPMRLSGPALETLAIIAYRQPIVRSEIERIRGVDTGGVLKTLLDRRLLRIVGRQDEPGQPLLYGTTKDFLEIFNLNALNELPTLKDIEDLMRERRIVTDAPPEGSLIATDEGDDEEHTEVIEGNEEEEEEEEETEVIKRKHVDDDEEEKGDGKDVEALAALEESLKGLKKIERSIFPKLPMEDESAGGQGGEGTLSTTGEPGEAQAEMESGKAEAAKADATLPDAARPNDRPFE